ncbi:hypothetical protein FPCIR_7621, partial [Fusarium pseudocircinatum]
DVLDTIDETEACLNIALNLEDVLRQFSDTGRNFVSKPPPSLNQSQPQAMDVDFPCDALPRGTDKSLPKSLERQLEKLQNARKLETRPHSFMNAVRACLGMCEKWIELVGEGLPKGALQFDSLFLHQTAGKAIHDICHPLHEQNRFDIWQEAGYLFAFIWSNEKLKELKAADYWSWLREDEISGLSPTYFLAIVCQMIVHVAVVSSPDIWMIICKRDDAAKSICGVYLQTIESIKRYQARKCKGLFINFLFDHHTGPDMNSEERRTFESVQSYQRRAADLVYKEETDVLIQKVNSASYSLSYSYTHQQYLGLLTGNPTMARSLASGSSRGSSLNSFRAFQAASRAMATVKED